MNTNVKAVTIEDLFKLVTTGKATAQDKMKLAELLQESAKEESQVEFKNKIEKIKAFIEKEGLTIQQVYEAVKEPVQPIFIWIDSNNVKHEKFGNEKGKPAAWIAEMKVKNTKEQALELALTQSGKDWVEKIYTPK